MYNYNSFIQESQFHEWEELDLVNEDMNSLMQPIQEYLDKEFEVNTSKFEESVVKLYQRFKGKLKILAMITSLLAGSYMGTDKLHSAMTKAGIAPDEQAKIESTIGIVQTKPQAPKKNEIKTFLHALAQKESSGDPKSVNSLGYIGKYQFGKMALEDLDLDDKITTHKFKRNPKIFPEHKQDEAMVKLLKINKGYLGEYVTKWEGKMINGIKITQSGLLSGAHLVGAKAVKQFLDSNGKIVPKDGNDVPVTDYIKKFGGYNIEI